MTEELDIYDGNMRPLGHASRDAAHEHGLWHRTFHCWVVAVREGQGFVVLQLRAANKKSFPNMLDITAAGHLEAGEAALDGIRELKEEIGVDPAPGTMTYLGIKHDVADVGSNFKNREFADVYLLRDDRPLTGYTLQVSEVSGLAEVSVVDGLRLFAQEVDEVSASAVRVLPDGAVTTFTRTIRREDLVPRIDSYYYKVFIMAQRLLDGSPYVAI